MVYSMFRALLENEELNVEYVIDEKAPPLIVDFAQIPEEFRLCLCGQAMSAEAMVDSNRYSYACITGGGCGRVVLINADTSKETWWRKE